MSGLRTLPDADVRCPSIHGDFPELQKQDTLADAAGNAGCRSASLPYLVGAVPGRRRVATRIGLAQRNGSQSNASIINYSAALIACDKGRVATRAGLAQHDGTAKV